MGATTKRTPAPVEENAPAPAEKGGGLVVIAPLVQVTFSNRAVQFYKGDVLPDGVSDESVKHLKDLGYVAESDN